MKAHISQTPAEAAKFACDFASELLRHGSRRGHSQERRAMRIVADLMPKLAAEAELRLSGGEARVPPAAQRKLRVITTTTGNHLPPAA